MEETRFYYIRDISSEYLTEGDHLVDVDLDGTVILKWALNGMIVWIEFMWLRIWTSCVLL
jgi:hypothetical protein